MTINEIFKTTALALSLGLLCLTACRDSEDGKADSDDPMSDPYMSMACNSPTLVGDSMQMACEYDLEVNGVDYGHTNADYQVTSTRGEGSSISADVKFVGATHRPDGGAIKVSLTDEGYELDAGSDGSVKIEVAPIDPEDPEASIDQIVVTTVSGTGLTKQHTITCPSLFGFADELEASGQNPVPPPGGCEGVSSPDIDSGCFPCEALEDLLVGQPVFVATDVKLRTQIAHHHSLALAQQVGNGDRGAVAAVIEVIASIVTHVWDIGVRCKIQDTGKYGCS